MEDQLGGLVEDHLKQHYRVGRQAGEGETMVQYSACSHETILRPTDYHSKTAKESS